MKGILTRVGSPEDRLYVSRLTGQQAKRSNGGTVARWRSLERWNEPAASARQFRSTVPPFHPSTVPPFHRSPVPPFHRSTVPPFHRSTVPPLFRRREELNLQH